MEYGSFIKTVEGNEGNLCRWSTRLDTYGCGCSHNCGYCYARSLLEFRGLWHPDSPRVADVSRIAKALDKIPSGAIVRMGGMTDCLQPAEQRHRVTWNTILQMNRRGIGYLVVTKSALVASDEYVAIYDPRLAHIQVSVTATDDDVASGFEHASPPSERIRAAERLEQLGFDVTLRLSPCMPEYVDFDVINGAKVSKVLVEFLRVNPNIRKVFDIDYSPYTLHDGGYWHMPLERKLEALKMIRGKELSVCDDVEEHYWHFRHHVNANPNDCCNLRLR